MLRLTLKIPITAKRSGTTRTLTVSVDRDSEAFARAEAERLYDGNVSRFIAALLREAERLAAMDRVLAGSGHASQSEAALDALRAEMSGKRARRKRRAA